MCRLVIVVGVLVVLLALLGQTNFYVSAVTNLIYTKCTGKMGRFVFSHISIKLNSFDLKFWKCFRENPDSSV